jgi:hypothetical protein
MNFEIRTSKKFAYRFDQCADIMNHFTEALGLSRHIPVLLPTIAAPGMDFARSA